METGIPRTTVRCILIEHLFKKKVAAWWVQHALTDVQKQYSKQFGRGENVLNRIIASNETQIQDFEPELKS